MPFGTEIKIVSFALCFLPHFCIFLILLVINFLKFSFSKLKYIWSVLFWRIESYVFSAGNDELGVRFNGKSSINFRVKFFSCTFNKVSVFY